MNTDTHDSTVEVRAGLDFDLTQLDGYLAQHMPEYTGPLQVRQFKGGQSNPTYLLTTPRRRYVLRRKPPGALLASAHAVDREYRVLTALGRASDVPVPRTRLLCTDATVIGTWFYVMDFVPGRIFWDAALPEILPHHRARYFEAMVDALAAVHRVDLAAAGLLDFGKPAQYISRQIARWSRQYLEDEAAGRVDAMDRLIEWLPQHLPADEPGTLVHGDFRIDNLMFDPVEPVVLAILDWELSTLGHPLADFAYTVMMYRMPPMGVTGLLGRDLGALQLPSESQYVDMYCRRTGRSGIPDLDFYVAFNFFRLAGILHGIRGRVQRGTAASAQARQHAANVEAVANIAWQQAQQMRL